MVSIKYDKRIPTKLSSNFVSTEFDCHCESGGCVHTFIYPALVDACEKLRTYIGPFTPNSGFRCREHNDSVLGRPSSSHLAGLAVDVPVSSKEDDIIYVFCHLFSGVGDARKFGYIHGDLRSGGFKFWRY